MFENILEWSIEDIKHKVTADIFYENKLGNMLKTLFDNNLLDALLNAYPELADWVEEKKNKIIIEKESKESEPREKYTDEELINNLQQKYKELNRNPYIREMSEPEGNVYISRFGSWSNALILAELIEDICTDVDNSEEAINKAQREIKDFAYKVERLPTKKEVDNLFSPGELISYFGSLKGLYDYLGEGYTEEELINILIDKRNKLGRNPINKDIKFPRPIIFIDKFNSWENALKEARLDE